VGGAGGEAQDRAEPRGPGKLCPCRGAFRLPIGNGKSPGDFKGGRAWLMGLEKDWAGLERPEAQG
jgi:hypothetical protein